MPTGREWVQRYMKTTERNYDYAQNFYEQREKIFFNAYQHQYDIRLDNILKQLSGADPDHNMPGSIYDTWTRLIRNSVENAESSMSSINAMYNFVRIHHLNVHIGKIGDNDGSIQATLGRIFEPFYVKNAQNVIQSSIGNIASNLIAGVNPKNVSVIQTGGVHSTSAVVSDSRDIRPDAFITVNGISIQDENGKAVVSNGKEKLDIELQELINLSSDIDQNGTNSILDKYLLDETFRAVGGLNLKYWQGDAHDQRFSNSSKLFSNFNTQMEQGGVNKSGVYTGGVAYAHNFLFLSNYLINIISPLTIGFVSGDKFTKVSELLTMYYFYFKMSHGIISKDTDTDDFKWHHYRAIDDTIRFYRIQKMRKNALLYKLKNAEIYLNIDGSINAKIS